jgi:hypothetical protein
LTIDWYHVGLEFIENPVLSGVESFAGFLINPWDVVFCVLSELTRPDFFLDTVRRPDCSSSSIIHLKNVILCRTQEWSWAI